MPTTPTVAKAHPGTKHNIHDVTYVSGKQLALFQYLRTSSDVATQDTHLSTLSRKANLRKQAFQLIRQWVDAEAEARLIQMLREYRGAGVEVATAYPYLGIARSEQEANDFVAMVMDEIVKPTTSTVAELADAGAGEHLRREGADRVPEGKLMANSPSIAGSNPAGATKHSQPGPLAARASKKRGAA